MAAMPAPPISLTGMSLEERETGYPPMPTRPWRGKGEDHLGLTTVDVPYCVAYCRGSCSHVSSHHSAASADRSQTATPCGDASQEEDQQEEQQEEEEEEEGGFMAQGDDTASDGKKGLNSGSAQQVRTRSGNVTRGR
ncbi:unnamed protein product [Merluccius merluccius]